MPPCVLILCPQADDRDCLAQTLEDRYTVLRAASTDEALRLMRSWPQCRLAYCEMGKQAKRGLQAARALKEASPDLTVIALVRPPCPDILRQAAQTDLFQAVRTLPLTAEILLEQTRCALCGETIAADRPNRPCSLLTRQEIDFLLGRVSLPELALCPAVH